MGSATSRSNTYVANATGTPLRVFYSVDTMELTDMVVDVEAEGDSDKQSGSAKATMTFKPDTRIRFIRIPVNESIKFSGEGVIYASVFIGSNSSEKCVKKISHNFHVPSDRSFIVTRNHAIKFQKYGENIWMDESGTMHR